jgi:hypothetical protein
MSKGSKAVSPSRGRSPNQPAAPVVQKGKAVSPSSSYANSRTPVHKNFDRHPHVGRKTERKD